ncbi:CHASE3 domain-containing protein [Sphingomonas sanguinis]|uniref:methyl-accepting chemotaxis protein n=1 Tax=Sphingomonas sanguinis TaxID=33051 RepID=UPI001C56F49B|nr:methyl-accepting chemotaxis protein [Sphingomonas sanguinis]QXT35986.1 CHASE3 domain-containing protein [Sphingomonas sanguinis]
MRFFDNLTMVRKLTLCLGIILALTLVTNFVIYTKKNQVRETTNINEHTYKVIMASNKLVEAMVNQETGLRGYLLTANRDFLAPYVQGASDFDRAMKEARQLTSDNPEQQSRLTDVGALAQRWRDEVAQPNVALMAAPATQADARASAAKGLGKALMDRLRAQAGAVISTENQLLARRQASQVAAFATISQAIFGGMLLSLVLAVAILILLVRQIARPVNAVTSGLTALASGDMAVTAIDDDRRDEVGQLASALNNLRGQLLAADEAKKAQTGLIVNSVGAALSKLAEGDLASRLDSDLDGPFAAIKTDFNRAADALENAMSQVSVSTGGIINGAADIRQASDDLSQRTEQQAASLEETAAAMDEITTTVRKTAEQAGLARQMVGQAKEEVQHSGRIMEDAVAAMNGIERASTEISDIISVIDGIAFQTNLLALNAGVEAARAGDAGKGFAVVASEVRALAQRSADAAKDVKERISMSAEQVDAGVGLVNETGKALARIVARITEINQLINDIAVSAENQSSGLQQVNIAVSQMDMVTQQNAAMVEEATAAARSLAGEADELSRQMSRFAIAHTGGRSAGNVSSLDDHRYRRAAIG